MGSDFDRQSLEKDMFRDQENRLLMASDTIQLFGIGSGKIWLEMSTTD